LQNAYRYALHTGLASGDIQGRSARKTAAPVYLGKHDGYAAGYSL
jgi:hypothetical protein